MESPVVTNRTYIILSLINLSHPHLRLFRFDRNDRSAAREEDVNGGVSPRKGYTRWERWTRWNASHWVNHDQSLKLGTICWNLTMSELLSMTGAVAEKEVGRLRMDNRCFSDFMFLLAIIFWTFLRKTLTAPLGLSITKALVQSLDNTQVQKNHFLQKSCGAEQSQHQDNNLDMKWNMFTGATAGGRVWWRVAYLRPTMGRWTLFFLFPCDLGIS